MEYVLPDFTKSEVQPRLERTMFCAGKVPLQSFIRVPAMSVFFFFCNVEVNPLVVTNLFQTSFLKIWIPVFHIG